MAKKTNKTKAISWALFDFGNSAYSLLIATFIFPLFFKEVIAANSPNADFYWGLIGSISIFIAGVTAPFIGAMSDYDLKRKKRFMFFTIISVMATALLYFTYYKTLFFASLIFAIANTTFTLAVFLNDSLLPSVSGKKTAGRISGLGFGLGYLGGILAMFLLKPFYSQGYSGFQINFYKLTFPLTALWFLIFSIPAFIFIKDKVSKRKKESFSQIFKAGKNNTLKTIKEIKKHKNISLFLIAFFLLNDALVTIFAFISIYATTTLSLTISQIFTIYLIIQLVAFPTSFFLGLISDKTGPKKVILFSLSLWILIILMLITAKSLSMYYLIAVLTGLVIGGSQSVARSWYANIIPKNKEAEFFGFNAFGSKIAAIFGPLVFGIISSATGSQKLAMASLIPFFLVSLIIFAKVKEKK